ncbi:MAG TPA: hypothetical protein VFI47_10185, partial [Acidimicrobiales bacterium]|nr:hypothetical protein [Acidimicrobiales bacterium]
QAVRRKELRRCQCLVAPEVVPAIRAEPTGALWSPVGEHVLAPPADLRQAAQSLGFAAPKLDVRGHDGIVRRAARAYEEFVGRASTSSGRAATRPACATW